MLFLKRCSDVFEDRRAAIIKDQRTKGRTQEQAEQRADAKGYYQEQIAEAQRRAREWTPTPEP
jgi:type I restriction-modification system DNA methylase subunit